MAEVLKLENVNLIYKSAESLSYKRLLKRKSAVVNEYKALNDISLSIEKGKIYGIVGTNGAGKSTLLRVLSGVMSPNSGRVSRNHSTINLLALGIGFSRELSGLDNVYLNGMLLGFTKEQISKEFDEIVSYSELGEFIYRPMKTYSSGMVSRLGFSVAIHLRPEVLLIDEVLSVGDVKFKEKSFNSLHEIIKDKDTTVVIVSHSMGQLEAICDKIIWLDKGRLIAQGEKVEVMGLYNLYTSGKLSIEEIMDLPENIISSLEGGFGLDMRNYNLRMAQVEEKVFGDFPIDFVGSFKSLKGELKITKRQLPNKDLFFFFEYSGLKDKVVISLDTILDITYGQELYEKPPLDPVYGENAISGFHSYLNLRVGSAIISNVYDYRMLRHDYEGEDSASTVLELIHERADISKTAENELSIGIGVEKGYSSFFIHLSKAKLFRDKHNLENFLKHYFADVKANKMQDSFFMTEVGTYSKLPYSIEPFTKGGYGINYENSLKANYMPFYNQTRERFYENFINNAVIQAELYQKKANGSFMTDYTRTRLDEDLKLHAPFIDIKYNNEIVSILRKYKGISPLLKDREPLKDYLNYLHAIYAKGEYVYKYAGGIFFTNYIKQNQTPLPMATLSLQLEIAMFMLQGWKLYGSDDYLSVFEGIILYLEAISEKLIKDNADIYITIRQNENETHVFSGSDRYYTLIRLLRFQACCIELGLGRDKTLEKLAESKVEYLRTTPRDIFKDDLDVVNDKERDERKEALQLYEKIKRPSLSCV